MAQLPAEARGVHFHGLLFKITCSLIASWNIDKRRAHLSSLILSGQTSRSEALDALTGPTGSVEVAIEVDFVARKMEITSNELESLLRALREGIWSSSMDIVQ